MTKISLHTKRIRRKRKYLFQFKPYYELESISFTEKVFTFLYCMERTGFTTQGEMDWCERCMKMNLTEWENAENEFKKQYKEFALNAK